MSYRATLLIWSFVWMVTFIDLDFAFRYRDTFLEWELNPVARWLYVIGGISLVIAARLMSMLLATIVACHKKGQIVTWVAATVHVFLLAYYVAGLS